MCTCFVSFCLYWRVRSMLNRFQVMDGCLNWFLGSPHFFFFKNIWDRVPINLFTSQILTVWRAGAGNWGLNPSHSSGGRDSATGIIITGWNITHCLLGSALVGSQNPKWIQDLNPSALIGDVGQIPAHILWLDFTCAVTLCSEVWVHPVSPWMQSQHLVDLMST